MGNVGEERTEREEPFRPEVARQSCDRRRERPPPHVRLDAVEEDDVAAVGPGVQKLVRRPIDLSRLALDEPDLRPRRLEVEELLRVDRRERLGSPGLAEVLNRAARGPAGVVPAAERGDDRGALQRWASLPD